METDKMRKRKASQLKKHHLGENIYFLFRQTKQVGKSTFSA